MVIAVFLLTLGNTNMYGTLNELQAPGICSTPRTYSYVTDLLLKNHPRLSHRQCPRLIYCKEKGSNLEQIFLASHTEGQLKIMIYNIDMAFIQHGNTLYIMHHFM